MMDSISMDVSSSDLHLPFVTLDPSDHMMSAMDPYSMNEQSGEDISTTLHLKAVKQCHLHILMLTIGYFFDKHCLKIKRNMRSRWHHEFICKTCDKFTASFACKLSQLSVKSGNNVFFTNFHFHHSQYCLSDKTISAYGVLENHPVVLDFVHQQEELMQQLQFGSFIMLSSLRSLLAIHGESLVVYQDLQYIIVWRR
jgi:hypothetical protein